MASQAPQSLPAISQPPQTSNIGYMGSQPMSMGYQPYNMQVKRPSLFWAWRGVTDRSSPPGSHFAFFQPGGSVSVWSQITQCWAPSYFPQNLMTTLPGQDASLPAQQPYITGQQPMYQQVSLSQPARGSADRMTMCLQCTYVHINPYPMHVCTHTTSIFSRRQTGLQELTMPLQCW